MLSEYALDPELLSNWKDFRFFASQFGSSHGRLISRFPKHWKGLVKEAAEDAEEVEFLRIVEALDRIDQSMIVRTYDYDKGHKWIRNAVDENLKRPFHAIVSGKSYGTATNFLVGGDIDPTEPPDLWVVPTSVDIERVPGQMVGCVTALLSQCEEVLFIDPYFGPSKRKHTEPLGKFLQAIASRGSRRMPGRIEYHAGNQDKDLSTYQTDLERWVKPHLPPNVTLTVIRWNMKQMHNRYIVTERGGVMFGHGLDHDDRRPVGHDTVSLLDDKTCTELMKDYSSKSTKLTWIGETISVTGV